MSSLFFVLGPWYDFPNMAGELMTKDDLMAYLRLSRGTINRLMKQGLPHIKLDRRVLFRKPDIDAYLESKIVKNKPQGKARKI